ncbi:BTAD domain-containing putative transcriptional regulator [Streptomyces sp. SP17BM10]|uniref:AfsR/SARP family transcriptional regulator n=1 Tax=Streptomyces sp. SP17BM10 TaxID=3002530 RepID=UPI002E78C652|nr:BTAD domain-containing putative transcriptional regulator [Streptomyces sp. SP17BM10]MEE1785657.1 BTAD domain-containing putative transcriptional regulator [Streptomyces sp. SP17BM10]
MLQVVFRILGPLDISADGRPVALQGARQRTVMSMLLLAPGRVVSVDTLADAVWNGSPPATARNQIAICVSGLRKTLKTAIGIDDLIVTSHPGYLLHPGEHRIDAVEFEERAAEGREAARRGRPEEARAHYEDALAMWRGPALAGITADAVEAEAARLAELRLDVHEQLTALRLDLGEHRELIGDLTAFVREHPLREQSLAHLMLAHYRAGRRAEALEAYRDGARLLADELGIDPGPTLQELHEDILNDAPKLTLPTAPAAAPALAVPAHLPPVPAAFTGRHQELAALDRLLEHQGGASLPVGSIIGTGGVGKTALAVHWSHQVAARFPDGQLFADLRGYDEEEEPRRPAAVLDRFLRALGVPGPQVPADPTERTALLRSVLYDRRVLIVLDNARSFEQIRPLLPGGSNCCVLVTSRDSLSSRLAGDYAFVPLHLASLGEDEAVALLSRVAGPERFAADPAGAARLSELCDRLPLALRIAAARLAAKPHWTVRTLVARLEDQHRRLDELSLDARGVRAGFRLSYRDLPAGAARMFRLLGSLNVTEFSAWAGAAVLDIDPVDAEDLIEQLVDAQLLEPLSASAGHVRYRFQDLLRLFARECALAEDGEGDLRQALRRACAVWLGLAKEAHRRVYGGDFTVVPGTAPLHPLPRHLTDDLVEDPMEWFEAERGAINGLIQQAARDDESGYAWDLVMTTVTLYQNRNYLEDWREGAEAALATARRTGDALAEAAMLHSLGTLEIVQYEHDSAYRRLGLALRLFEEQGQDQGRALVLRNLALCERQRGDLDRAVETGRRSLEIFRRGGDRYAEAHVLGLLAQIELERGDAQASLVLSSEAVARSRGLGTVRGEAQSTVRLAEALIRAGDGVRAEEACRRALELVLGSGDRRGETHVLRALGEALWCQGRGEEAEPVLRSALQAAEAVPDTFLQARAGAVLGCVQALRGDRDGAVAMLRTASGLFAEVGAGGWSERVDGLMVAIADGGPVDSGRLFGLVQP